MYSICYTCLWSVYFGRVSFWRFLWRAGSYFLLCGAPLCGVAVRYNLFECQLGVGGGPVQVFSFFWALLWWVRYDLLEFWPGVGGGAVQVFLVLFVGLVL